MRLLLTAFLLACRAPAALRDDGAVRVTAGVDSEQSPCLAPDGDLVFTRFSRGYNHGPSAVVRLDLLRDGTRIVYPRDTPAGSALRVVDRTTGADVPLTDGFDDREPNTSPVDDLVVFQSDRGGTWGLWEVPASGGTPDVRLDTAAEETDASYAPDSDDLVFATDDCEALSCIAVERGGEIEVFEGPTGWYDGAPALAGDAPCSSKRPTAIPIADTARRSTGGSEGSRRSTLRVRRRDEGVRGSARRTRSPQGLRTSNPKVVSTTNRS